ncbi:hypothetical protein SKAU_G00012440 [Synaphobranchus kaupii]|uniref:MANSC domain-containing protein n=1 Tax=Synaphobranchus kaupii TaxID=118154 RepID=A0A9Q1GBG0_SYNKA|nr:hypothetical protein SKAU_G00012440 [Synaphobranchus kaupii]
MAENRCPYNSSYKNCWIRRFPGTFIDIEESERRGAGLLKSSHEENAMKCSRACCLTRNFSCNLAVFHYKTILQSVNCVHLHCPTLESCVLRRRSNPTFYNGTKGSTVQNRWPGTCLAQFSLPLLPPTLSPLTPPPQRPAGVNENPSSSISTAAADPQGAGGSITTLPSSTQTASVHLHTMGEPSPATLHTTSPIPTSIKLYHNNTKDYVSHNHNEGEGGGYGLSPQTLAWHLMANALVVPLVVCTALLACCCCCSVVLPVGLRARRKRFYRASATRGSTYLINYVIVKRL